MRHDERPSTRATLGAGGGEPAHEVYFKESVYGPVSGTVTSKARRTRSPTTARPRPRARRRGRVQRAGLRTRCTARSSSSKRPTNSRRRSTWRTSTAKNIAYFSTGRLPNSAPGTDPTPADARQRRIQWRGFLSLRTAPARSRPGVGGLLLNWNNKPAPEWGAASNNGREGPVQRVQMYKGFTNGMTEAKDV